MSSENKEKSRILAFDVETGGTFAKKNPLLTAYFGIYNEETLSLIDELELYLLPKEGHVCDPKAMEVTGIVLEDHINDSRSLSLEEGGKKLLAFLEKNKIPGKKKSLMPMAHNSFFDKTFIFEQLLDIEEWERIVHYRTIDTFNTANDLKRAGLLPEELGSLQSLVEYFGIPKLKAHAAKDDVHMMIQVYTKMINIIKSLKISTSGSTNILDILEFKE